MDNVNQRIEEYNPVFNALYVFVKVLFCNLGAFDFDLHGHFILQFICLSSHTFLLCRSVSVLRCIKFFSCTAVLAQCLVP